MPLDTHSLLAPKNLDDLPLDHAFKIPPLQNPITLLASRRPSPLEPNAGVHSGSHRPTARLDTHAKALTDVKPAGDDENLRGADARLKAVLEQPQDFCSLSDGARKRQKLDFFQLPKPSAKSSASKRPAFGSVPVLLNKLHEPPPSAALLPPITANIVDDATPSRDARPAWALPSIERADHEEAAVRKVADLPKPDQEGKQKRVYLRGRRPWTAEETEDLLKGVTLYGVGKWKSILREGSLHFHPDRTSVDLKDRYRTCRLNQERTTAGEASQRSRDPRDTTRHQISSTRTAVLDMATRPSRESVSHLEASNDVPTQTNDCENKEFNVCTPLDFQLSSSRAEQKKDNMSSSSNDAKPYLPRWTLNEDVNLSKGYQKHGFRWTAITRDPELNLGHRTGPQVRDRFRLKFPLYYQAASPIPTPDAPKGQGLPKPDLQHKVGPSRSKYDEGKRQKLTWILRDSLEAPQSNLSRSSVAQSVEERDRTEISDDQRHSFPSADPQNEHEASHSQGKKLAGVEDTRQSQSTPPASLSSGERSRQTSVDVDENRNMNIDDLLNSDGEQQSRLPPFKFPFDNEWSSETLNDSLTLPPLLWEDLASRPLFDLE